MTTGGTLMVNVPMSANKWNHDWTKSIRTELLRTAPDLGCGKTDSGRPFADWLTRPLVLLKSRKPSHEWTTARHVTMLSPSHGIASVIARPPKSLNSGRALKPTLIFHGATDSSQWSWPELSRNIAAFATAYGLSLNAVAPTK